MVRWTQKNYVVIPATNKLSDLAFVARLDPQLLVAVKADVFAALDNDRTDSKCRSDACTDRSSDRSAGNGTDDQSGSGRRADLDAVIFERTLADRRALGIDAFYIVAFNRHYFGQDGTKIRPTVVSQDDAVERQRKLATAFEATGFGHFADAALDGRSGDLGGRDDLGGKFVALAAFFGADVGLHFEHQFRIARDDDDGITDRLIG